MKGKEGLYGALEEVLKKAKEPMDAHALFDDPRVKEHAATPNRVSDYLGNLWRRGTLVRVKAPQFSGSRTQWLYAWKGLTHKTPSLAEIKASADFSLGKVNTLLSRPSLEITEEGKTVVITTANLTITIKQR